MTPAEELEELKTMRDAIKTALSDNVSSGALLGYTTNGTKIVYEGATKSYELLQRINSDIAQLSIAITNNLYSGQ